MLSTLGMVITAAGMVLLASLPRTAGIPHVMGALALVGLGLATFSAPNVSAIMGSVPRPQLSLASAFLGTMRVTGMALSVALLGGIAASQLGRAGGRILYTHGHGDRGHQRRRQLRHRLQVRHAHRRRPGARRRRWPR